MANTRGPARLLLATAFGAAMLGAAPHAVSALHVYEPFDYGVGILDGTTANGFGLGGAYDDETGFDTLRLRVTSPGLSYGALSAAPAARGGKLTQQGGATAGFATVNLASPIVVAAGSALYFSALFTLDDSENGTHLASIALIDDATAGQITFGEPTVGVRALRIAANTPGTGGNLISASESSAFSNGQTLLLIGRYTNALAADSDRLQLLGYDTAVAAALPASFDPNDPQRLFAYDLADVTIDLERISQVRFAIRGADNNYIDELRIGTGYAEVALIPEPQTWALMLAGAMVVGLAVGRRMGA